VMLVCVADCFEKWHTRMRIGVWALNGVIVNCAVTQFVLAYSLNKSLLYTVWLFFYRINMSQVSRKNYGEVLWNVIIYIIKMVFLYFMTK
jgi:hypothetical protein